MILWNKKFYKMYFIISKFMVIKATRQCQQGEEHSTPSPGHNQMAPISSHSCFLEHKSPFQNVLIIMNDLFPIKY